MMEMLALFHFIRPFWLLAIPLILVLWWLSRRSQTRPPQWTQAIATHLANALILDKQKLKRFYAIDLTAVIMVLSSVAVSGPTWSRIPNPFYSETAPLAIVLNVNSSMLTNDIQPTRLERSKFKILDLLKQRAGARTALIAYAGSAHRVLPLTEDPDLLRPFLEGLSPDVMPVSGNDASLALDLAHQALLADETPGSILFLTDSVEPSSFPAFQSYQKKKESYPIIALIVGTEEGGNIRLASGQITGGAGIARAQINQWKRAGNIGLVNFEAGDADLRRISRIVASNLRSSLDQDSRADWLDRGWWLLWPILLLMLVSFRRGWTIAW